MTRRIFAASIVGTIGIGLSVLVGWIFDVPLLKSVIPGAVEMKANTALWLVFGAAALFILERRPGPPMQRIGCAMAALVAALGLATLGEYASGWQLGIDELLVRDTGTAFNAIRGRMSPYSAVAFASIGVAIAAYPWRRLRQLTILGSLAVLLIGGVSLVGYLWNAKEFTTDRWLPPVAVNTAVAFLLLGMATLLAPQLRHRLDARILTGVESRVLAGFIGAMIVLFAIGWYTYRAEARFTQTASQVIRTQETRSAVGAVYEAVSDQLFAERNYLFTADEAHKQAYQIALSKINERLDLLGKLTAADPSQYRRYEELRKLITFQTSSLNDRVALFERTDFTTTHAAIIRDRATITTMSQVRNLLDEMDHVESTLLAKHSFIFSQRRDHILVAILALLGASAAVFALLFASIHQGMTKRTQAANEVQRTIAAKESFLAMMSHEIRTPVSGILGMLDLLGLSRLDDQQRELLSVAHESGDGLVRIIDDLLDHAKISAGKLQIRPEPSSIPQIVRRVVGTYHAVASAKDLNFVESVDPRISPWLLADAQRIAQILGNFVSNAIKFTQQGSVQLRVERLETPDDGETVRFSVQDTGIGISVEAQQRLFQPFEQATLDTTRVYGGTGLGLAISRKLAQMMGAEVALHSVVGEGTTMSLTLLLTRCDMPLDEDPNPTGSRLPGITTATGPQPTVLAVDDHPTNRLLLGKQLASLGVRPHLASTGKEALELWRNGGFDLVITDCNMPVMDGYALTRAIREIEVQAGGHTPIIAWTATVLASAANRCHEAGMDDLLSKPANIAQLRQMLSKWIVVPGARAAPPIDQAALDRLSGDEAGSAEILAEFLAQTTSDLAALDAALASDDLAECAQVAHRIRGASRMVGARGLAAASETIARASGQEISQVQALRPALDTSLQELVNYAASFASDKETS
ncbi:MAG: ATP-binding protein [Rhodanobacter sp.]